MTLSLWATSSVKEVAATGPGIRFFQLYVYKDRNVVTQLVRRAERAGFKAIALTVDTPKRGRPEADIKNRFTLPPHLTLKNFEGLDLGCEVASNNKLFANSCEGCSNCRGCKSSRAIWSCRNHCIQSRIPPTRLFPCNYYGFRRVCPLAFPNTKHIAQSCGNTISNLTACCNAMESYVSHLQKQSLMTNLQALDCATLLGMKLQKSNITTDVYKLYHLSLKDFSLQAAGSQESRCLLPSMPSDGTFDKSSGISFICDVNDNIPAPWPSTSQLPAPSCNKTIRIPALPAAASAQSGLYSENMKFYQLFASSVMLIMLI